MKTLTISGIYRRACRDILLSAENKQLLMRLLREIATNIVRSRKDWTIKQDFITLWWLSVGRFPELSRPPWNEIILSHINAYLPFELSGEERAFLTK